MARTNLNEFIRYTMPEFRFAKHHRVMIKEIQRAIASDRGRLYIGMPPRHGKSETGTIRTIGWYLGRFPKRKVMLLCHGQDTANEFSRQIRELVRDNERYGEVFPDIELHSERSRINDWRTTAGGGLKAVGVGGGITGHGADLMVIDDPHKEGDDLSVTVLDQVFHWYASAARTRLSPGASIVFIMTRWHPLDLAGRLLDLGEVDAHADRWRQVVFPALALENDRLGRSLGDPLWPEQYSLEELLAVKSNDDRMFQALYQNNPRGSDDVMFSIEKVDWVDSVPRGRRFWTCDLAISKKDTADYTVLALWVYSGKKLYLIDSLRLRETFSDIRARLLRIARRHRGEKIVFPKEFLETLIYEDLRGEMGAGILTTVSMKGDKVQKAQHPATIVNSGRLGVLIDAGSDNDYFVRELGEFPVGRYDDCVDAFSVAAHYIGARGGGTEMFINGKVIGGG